MSYCLRENLYELAECIYEDALKGHLDSKKDMLGYDHPATLEYMKKLAKLYDDRDRFEDAKTLYLDWFLATEAKLGPNHADTRSAINDIAIF